jgi:hypothetical protein
VHPDRARDVSRTGLCRIGYHMSDTEFVSRRQSISTSLFCNREMSWLDFNQRVLDQATSDHHPLLERELARILRWLIC